MKIINNRFIPFGDFHGLNLFGVIFVQKRWGRMTAKDLNHEAIHTRQQLEMGFLPFYLWYVVEFVVRWFLCRFDSLKAYYAIGFEREAYANERNLNYLRGQRRCYSWWKYLRLQRKSSHSSHSR